MKDDLKYIGKTLPIHDVREKVTGQLRYVGDMMLHNMLYGKLLLSSISHGIIKEIDTSKAEALQGVIKVFTYKNSVDKKYNSYMWYKAMDTVKDEVLFTNRVRFMGDRIAAVVATSKEIAEEALTLIKVDYEELPFIDAEGALVEENIKIHPWGNIMSKREMENGRVDEALKKDLTIVEDTIETQKVHHAAMETHACVADSTPDGTITLWSPCQVAFQVQLIVSEALGIPTSKIRVIKTAMGGSFGGKGQPILEPICAYLSLNTGAPVRLEVSRAQAIIGTRTRNATKGRVRIAVDKEGMIVGRDIDVLVDGGAYHTNGDAVALAMGKKAFRLYRIKNQRYKSTTVYSNTPIGGACRGYGSPQIHAITEINIDNAARAIGMDPVELRLKNLVHPYDKDPLNGPDLGNGRVIDCLEKGKKAFNWEEKFNNRGQEGRFVTGVGVACGVHGNGYYGAHPDYMMMTLKVLEDGKILMLSGLHDLGCGTITTMKQIVGEVLKIHPDNIIIPEADTFYSPYDSAGTQASRVTFVCGGCAQETANLLKEKIYKYSAAILECTEDAIEMLEGVITNSEKPSDRISLSDLLSKVRYQFKREISVTNTYESKANPGVYTVNFVEVMIDKLTGMVKILDVLSVSDIGRAINPGFVEGQVHGAIQMGIGFALSEEIKLDAKGRVTTANFSKYHVINAPDMPKVKVILVEEGEEYGPFGAKSIGELATVAIAPAIINAINWALDINISSLPATPEKIIEALNKKAKQA
ncbi:xanthine dehydrogenase family protein molybdopterin-binding subunit [Alkaliphilus serpentinus]|uniref:Molybdopterin-dependent oxidoreductase n=1 Tax=Alkaliphilus serpentinus TaxID=1482731 RepID=A0A833HND9_9FIRM|nr:molybdopterin cofactor-binding domain-containing protein [Alkaliphilus serpentinus]KAB3529311.1 molybdopterin-dependent oxidoreductase [Alkaliphilus serpentinus]